MDNKRKSRVAAALIAAFFGSAVGVTATAIATTPAFADLAIASNHNQVLL
jgi:hypothetical protein